MALFEYLKKVEDSVSESASQTGLRQYGENQVMRRPKLLSAPQWKKKKNKTMDTMTNIKELNLPNGVSCIAIELLVGNTVCPESTVRGLINSYRYNFSYNKINKLI